MKKTASCFLTVAAMFAHAQTAFEPASFKAALKPGFNLAGGPGSKSPGIFTGTGNLRAFVQKGWDVSAQQVVGTTIDSTYYTVNARLPDTTSPENFRLMVQNLLLERLSLKARVEMRELTVLKLVVGKNGPKLKDHQGIAEESVQVDPTASPHDMGGFQLNQAKSGLVAINKDMKVLVTFLEFILGQKVVDGTGLTGLYDFNLQLDMQALVPPDHVYRFDLPASTAASATVYQAVSDLGLRLEQQKAVIPVVIVESFQQKPAEN
jgi:uncharacterized protein (TIGR03435 family)